MTKKIYHCCNSVVEGEKQGGKKGFFDEFHAEAYKGFQTKVIRFPAEWIAALGVLA